MLDKPCVTGRKHKLLVDIKVFDMLLYPRVSGVRDILNIALQPLGVVRVSGHRQVIFMTKLKIDQCAIAASFPPSASARPLGALKCEPKPENITSALPSCRG